MAHAIDILKTSLNDVKKRLSANKLQLNPDKIEIIIFGSKIQYEKVNKYFLLIFLVISSVQQWPSETLVYGLIVIFPFCSMSRISVSRIFSQIRRISEAI